MKSQECTVQAHIDSDLASLKDRDIPHSKQKRNPKGIKSAGIKLRECTVQAHIDSDLVSLKDKDIPHSKHKRNPKGIKSQG